MQDILIVNFSLLRKNCQMSFVILDWGNQNKMMITFIMIKKYILKTYKINQSFLN